MEAAENNWAGMNSRDFSPFDFKVIETNIASGGQDVEAGGGPAASAGEGESTEAIRWET